MNHDLTQFRKIHSVLKDVNCIFREFQSNIAQWLNQQYVGRKFFFGKYTCHMWRFFRHKYRPTNYTHSKPHLRFHFDINTAIWKYTLYEKSTTRTEIATLNANNNIFPNYLFRILCLLVPAIKHVEEYFSITGSRPNVKYFTASTDFLF